MGSETGVGGVIARKGDFYTLWRAGVLGNRPQVWTDPCEAYAAGVPMVGFREVRSGGAGSGVWELVPRMDVLATAERWRALGRSFVMDSAAPNERTTLAGEVARTYRGLEGTLGYTRCSLREAYARGLLRPYGGAAVLALLDSYMDPSSRDDLEAIWTLYPDAVIEFSCFDVDVGLIPGRNTLIWEVRCY